MPEYVILTPTSSATANVHSRRSANTSSTIRVSGGAEARKRQLVDDSIVDAVFGHIRAVRALGRTTINTAEIAEALNLPSKKVEHAVNALSRKGVRKKR